MRWVTASESFIELVGHISFYASRSAPVLLFPEVKMYENESRLSLVKLLARIFKDTIKSFDKAFEFQILEINAKHLS